VQAISKATDSISIPALYFPYFSYPEGYKVRTKRRQSRLCSDLAVFLIKYPLCPDDITQNLQGAYSMLALNDVIVYTVVTYQIQSRVL
jgi:hypothetical protein